MIPFQTYAGQKHPIGSITKSDVRFRARSTTIDECREYAEALEQAGYTKRAEKSISAGSKYSYNENLFYAYQNEEENVFVFWDASIYTVFVTVEPKGLLPDVKQILESVPCVEPTVTQLKLKNGMCYAVRLENGEFIIVDGGIKDEEAEARLYEFLKENSPNRQPTVALWIFTHCHKDHIGLATNFVRDYKDKVCVKAFAYQFPNCEKVQVAMEDVELMKTQIDEFEENIKNAYPNALVYTLHTGQSYFYPGVEIEILWSIDDTFPYPYLSFNDTSASFRLKFKNGKTVLYLGDCQNEVCKKIATRYGDYLKSDVMQVTHHGLIGGDKGLYEIVDPEICLWAISEKTFLGANERHRYQYCIGEGGSDYNAYLRDESIRKRTHYHHGETITIKI